MAEKEVNRRSVEHPHIPQCVRAKNERVHRVLGVSGDTNRKQKANNKAALLQTPNHPVHGGWCKASERRKPDQNRNDYFPADGKEIFTVVS
jgi:hypothetical protein